MSWLEPGVTELPCLGRRKSESSNPRAGAGEEQLGRQIKRN